MLVYHGLKLGILGCGGSRFKLFDEVAMASIESVQCSQIPRYTGRVFIGQFLPQPADQSAIPAIHPLLPLIHPIIAL